MSDWIFAHRDDAEELARLHHFTVKKKQADQDIEFLITVREYVKPKEPTMLFFAQADKQTNQTIAAYTPSGWGQTLLEALSKCMHEIRRFPYEPQI